MILGLEGVHTWSDGGIVINDRSTWPQLRLDEIGGLIGSADLDPLTDKATGRTGEVPRRSDRGGKTVTYVGRLLAESLSDLVELRGAVVAAFDGTDEGTMVVAPHPDGDDSLPTRTYYARPLECVVEENQREHSPYARHRGFERVFSIALRLSDPRYYHPDLVTATHASSVSPNNVGNTDTEAIITIDGTDMTDVTLTNTTLDVDLKLTDLPNVEQIIIDSKRRTIKRGSGDNLREFYDPTSTWWDMGQPFIAPGVNTITLAGGDSFTVEFYPADAS